MHKCGSQVSDVAHGPLVVFTAFLCTTESKHVICITLDKLIKSAISLLSREQFNKNLSSLSLFKINHFSIFHTLKKTTNLVPGVVRMGAMFLNKMTFQGRHFRDFITI